MIEIAQHAFTRMDGAWFLALAKKFGIETAWNDVEAWKQFLMFSVKTSEKLYSDSVWPRVFLMRWIFQQGIKN